jgi:ABC-2 type transport system ATP-binding protein
VAADAGGATLQVKADEVAGAVSRLLGALPVADLTVEDPPLEEVMKELFARSREEREAAADAADRVG